MQRREFLLASAATVALGSVPLSVGAAEAEWIYISPLKSNGDLSRCQAEVWYVSDGDDFMVVTASDAWRAKAVQRDLTEARIWIGKAGEWQSSNTTYKSLPSVKSSVALESDPTIQARMLNKFGEKYPGDWSGWGPRFKRGLADGSRVMLRYKQA